MLIVSDGGSLKVAGNRIGNTLSACSIGDCFKGTEIGRSNPMVTPTETTRGYIAGATFTVTSTVKLRGAR